MTRSAAAAGLFDPGCPFCRIAADGAYDWSDSAVVRFVPLDPVAPGHVLFVPKWHCVGPDPLATQAMMAAAEAYGAEQSGDYNLVTSRGPAATQTVGHLHTHFVPRRAGDGLHLPWTGQDSKGKGG